MLWIVVRIGLVFLIEAGALCVCAQPAETPKGEATEDHLSQLENIRAGIVDPQARPEERRRWSELLLSYASPEAKALTVELLGMSDSPEVQRSLCQVIADRARQAPERLDVSLAEPLVELLGAEQADLRAMAAAALAEFPGTDVPSRLGAIAAESDASTARRLAAIDALAPNTHRREVVAQLIGLLDAEAPEITERVVGALESTTPETFGLDCDKWRHWWREELLLDEEAWLAGQLRFYRDRCRSLAHQLQTFRDETRRDQTAITSRVHGFQRELFRALSGDQRDAKLTEWLGDSLPVVQFNAFSIIKAQMADEGKRPEGEVLIALLILLRDGSPEMRREVLDIAQNLNDPVVVEAVLARLEIEDDPTTRHAIFTALGKLDSPDAVPALIREIAEPAGSSECVREAATALGRVAGKSPADALADAVGALKGRYESTASEDVAMRGALLAAMAGVGSDEFVPEFLQAIDSDDATLLQPAIRGLLAVGNVSKLPRLRALAGHADPRVRLAAVNAVGQLGREETDIECLLTRLNPAIETNELAGEAAWRGFRDLLSRHSARDRFEAADRLRDLPDLEVRYLEELADALPAGNGDSPVLEAVLDRLSAVLVTEGRYDEAIVHLRALHDSLVARGDPGAAACGLRLLNAMVRGAPESEAAQMVRQLAATAGDDAAKERIIGTVADYLESPDLSADPQRARRLVAELREIRADTLPDAWTQLLDATDRRLEPGDAEPAQQPPPTPGD